MAWTDFLKKLFNKKVLSLPQKHRDVLIQPHSSGYTTIKLGQKISVDPGWSAVIVVKDEVADVFMEGTHEMSLAYIPKTTKILRLDKGKVKKDRVLAEVILPSSFKCDLYFVRMDYIQGRKWQSDLIKVREKDKKNLRYKMSGNYSFQVQAPDKVVGLFLIDWGKIKTGRAIVKLDDLVSDLCTEILWDKKVKDRSELTQYDFGNLVLKPPVYKNFVKYGLCIVDMEIEKIVYPESVVGDKYVEVSPDKEDPESSALVKGRIGDINKIETEIEYKAEGKLISQIPRVEEENKEQKRFPFYDFNDPTHKNLKYTTPETLKSDEQVDSGKDHSIQTLSEEKELFETEGREGDEK